MLIFLEECLNLKIFCCYVKHSAICTSATCGVFACHDETRKLRDVPAIYSAVAWEKKLCFFPWKSLARLHAGCYGSAVAGKTHQTNLHREDLGHKRSTVVRAGKPTTPELEVTTDSVLRFTIARSILAWHIFYGHSRSLRSFVSRASLLVCGARPFSTELRRAHRLASVTL